MESINRSNNVIITGGTQGLGFSIAKELISNGCQNLLILGRDQKKGSNASKQLSKNGVNCLFRKCDVSIVDDCKTAFEYGVDNFGFINGLVNAAAITTRGTILDTSIDLWDDHMNTNLRGPFILIQSIAKHLIKHKKPGSIVNILSTSAYVGQSILTPYSTSKGGLITLTKNVANSLKKHKIRVNGVAPGWMETPGEDKIQKEFHDADNNWLEEAEKKLPFGQLVKTHEISPLICYLISSSSGIITGSIINYDQNIIGAVPE